MIVITALRIFAAGLVATVLSLEVSGQSNLNLESTTIQVGDIRYRASAGTLRVPENRTEPGSRLISLAFVRLHSTADEPGPPLFYLPGGPGNPATPGARLPTWEPFLEVGDVVFLDPRGVGQSEPDLSWRSDDILAELFFGDRDTAVEHMSEIGAAARDYFVSQGIDLRGYNAREMADDVNALRVALGYEVIHLMGHSWGTSVGLVVIRRHPAAVARFVSVGTAGPDEIMKLPSQLDRSLARLSAVIADDPTVGEAMPDFFGTVERVVAMLEDDPLEVTLPGEGGQAERQVLLGAFGLQLLLVADLADTSDLVVYPRLLRSLERRDGSIVRWFLQKRIAQFGRLPALMLGARAASGATEARWKRIQDESKASPFANARCMFSPESDAALGFGSLGDDFRVPVTGEQHVLFISGDLDAATPVEQAEGVRRGFANAGHLIVTNAGHEDLLPDAAVRDVIVGFLAGDAPVDMRLELAPLIFAPVEGPITRDHGVQHPALALR